MFAKSKTTPLHNVGTNRPLTSSRKLSDLNSKQIFNRSFDTAQNLLQKSAKLKQTNLRDFNIKENKRYKPEQTHENCAPIKAGSTSEFFLLPMPKAKPVEKLNSGGAVEPFVSAKEPERINPLTKNGRNSLALLGKVDYCLKMHKMHPAVDALWDVYGKLHKIVDGKQRYEHVLLLRNANGGAILQCSYYDFEQQLWQFPVGCYLRAVGRFVGTNRLQTFKLEQRYDEKSWDQLFTRIQNVNNFMLVQNNAQKCDN